jgi:hypothetical protein
VFAIVLTLTLAAPNRFEESKVFEQLFEEIVRQCVEVGLVQGKHLSVDGSFVEANAAKESRIPREQLAEAAQVNRERCGRGSSRGWFRQVSFLSTFLRVTFSTPTPYFTSYADSQPHQPMTVLIRRG